MKIKKNLFLYSLITINIFIVLSGAYIAIDEYINPELDCMCLNYIKAITKANAMITTPFLLFSILCIKKNKELAKMSAGIATAIVLGLYLLVYSTSI